MAKKKIKVPELLADNKDILFDLMAQSGVEKINVTFNGEGDSGQIEDVFITPEVSGFLDTVLEGVKISNGLRYVGSAYEICWKEGPCSLLQLLNSLCYSVLEQKYGGWENNDGGFGEFVFDGATRKANLEMNTRYTEVNTENNTF